MGIVLLRTSTSFRSERILIHTYKLKNMEHTFCLSSQLRRYAICLAFPFTVPFDNFFPLHDSPAKIFLRKKKRRAIIIGGNYRTSSKEQEGNKVC